LKNGHRDLPAIVHEKPGHADFFSDNSGHCKAWRFIWFAWSRFDCAKCNNGTADWNISF
jgi:hypothetical protein